jgi:hypothetical protein
MVWCQIARTPAMAVDEIPLTGMRQQFIDKWLTLAIVHPGSAHRHALDAIALVAKPGTVKGTLIKNFRSQP